MRNEAMNKDRTTGTRSWVLYLCLIMSGAVSLSTGLAQAQDGADAEASAVSTEAPPTPVQTSAPTAAKESNCSDREDNDGDGLTDCADADCYDEPVCEAGGDPEQNNERCSDWIDNDGDGAVDCEDEECHGPGVTVCEGSMQSGASQAASASSGDDLPELTGDMTAFDLIGGFGDVDGERNEYLCSDGIDNDGDGRTDCQDFGCRFDPMVTVCQDSGSAIKFSIVAGLGVGYNLDEQDGRQALSAGFQRIQARALGSIPGINDSFFILSMRLDDSVRLTFAHFQIPINNLGYYVALNSGQGGLSSGPIISTSKRPLLDSPYYLYNAFEQGNGAAFELGGPIAPGVDRVKFRAFAAAGRGLFAGNVGGFRTSDQSDANFAWNAGAQLHFDILGYFSRFDSGLLYQPASTAFAVIAGAKYDQRPVERYPAANLMVVGQHDRFHARVEGYTKYVLDWGGSMQSAWNAQVSWLAIPQKLSFAADVGQFYTSQDYDATKLPVDNDGRPADEFQWRVAAHYFWWRHIGLLSLLYSDHRREESRAGFFPAKEREIRLETQFRF